MDPLEFPCPKCKAIPGLPCVEEANGRNAAGPHASRVRNANGHARRMALRQRAAAELGRAGGSSKSAKKAAASRLNGLKGGRPEKKPA